MNITVMIHEEKPYDNAILETSFMYIWYKNVFIIIIIMRLKTLLDVV